MSKEKKKIIEDFVCCPECRSGVKVQGKKIICCQCGQNFEILNGDIPSMFSEISQEVDFSRKKWDKMYKNKRLIGSTEKINKGPYGESLKNHLLALSRGVNKKVFVEIGCGLSPLGEGFINKGWFYIGVDFSKQALTILKRKLAKSKGKFLLIHADVRSLPIRKKTVGMIVGLGVIEHFKNTQPIINLFYDCLSSGGLVFNCIPSLNIGNLFYRQIWGGIPNVFLLRNVFEFLHIKLLGGKHMIFGYELQFTRPQLIVMHLKAGFSQKNISIGRFDCGEAQLYFLKIEKLRRILRRLCIDCYQFWPMVEVIAKK